MKKLLHLFGVHDWRYGVPQELKIKERIMDRIDIFTQLDTGKTWEGYATFQQKTCLICEKTELDRIDN